jgi:hypothetical protein
MKAKRVRFVSEMRQMSDSKETNEIKKKKTEKRLRGLIRQNETTTSEKMDIIKRDQNKTMPYHTNI